VFLPYLYIIELLVAFLLAFIFTMLSRPIHNGSCRARSSRSMRTVEEDDIDEASTALFYLLKSDCCTI
jgi:hypothetical protein